MNTATEGDGAGTLVRRTDSGLVRGALADVLPGWRSDERWLFVTPHDDDPVISAAMVLAAAVEAGVEVQIRIVSDGSMGYTAACGADEIVATRRRETLQAFRHLGVIDVGWYDYPDAQLHLWQGRRPLGAGEVSPDSRAGAYTGITDSIVRDVRASRPTRVLTMAGSDLHPDHQVVFRETRIAIFHAAGDIWPDLGPPMRQPPQLFEFAAYAPFEAAPDYQFEASARHYAAKLAAVRAYASQTQVAELFRNVIEAGAFEHMRTVPTAAYAPARYIDEFKRQRD